MGARKDFWHVLARSKPQLADREIHAAFRRLLRFRRKACLAFAVVASGCEPTLVVGTWLGAGAGKGGAEGAAGLSGAGGNGGFSGSGAPSGGREAGAGTGGSGGASSGGVIGAAGTAGDALGGAGAEGGAGGEGACDATVVPNADGGAASDPVTVPWSTGFEDGLCGYARALGYCFATGDAHFEAVAAPTHEGVGAAAFVVNSSAREAQARCVRQGTFPPDAVYGAWFYVTAAAADTKNWNLMFFNGGPAGSNLMAFWDVSIDVIDGRNVLVVFDQQHQTRLVPTDGPDVPIGSWFHVELRLRRSAQKDGLIELYQDGVRIYSLSGIVTDTTEWGQWYVGNLAAGRTPPNSTLYIDDVSIRLAP